MEGWRGWDEYAPFYDWENARTLGRRDVPFWRRLAIQTGGRVLELGCGTGRVSASVARVAGGFVGIDRSAAMLARGRKRLGRARLGPPRALLVRGDIRHLPFRPASFDLVMAPYGVLQSLLDDEDLSAALQRAARATRRGGRLGVDLVPDLPRWREYERHVRLRGRRGRSGPLVTLVESVRQDRRRSLTRFDQEFVERHGRARCVRRFSVTFRTLPAPTMAARIEGAGFRVDAVLGDYRGGPWDPRADVWIILATRR